MAVPVACIGQDEVRRSWNEETSERKDLKHERAG